MLSGQLVTLRALEPDDVAALARWANDVETEVFGGGDPPRPRPLAAVQSLYERMSAPGDGANFAIEAEGRLIGQAGLFGVDNLARVAGLGITIGEKSHWGRGYGGDAVSVLVNYGFRHLNLRKIWLTVNGTNERAIRCYASAGFVEEGRQRAHTWSDGQYIDQLCMAIFAPGEPAALGG